MSKRARSENLTGGSKDVNPQWFGMQVSQSAIDATTTQSFPLPVQRLQNRDKKSLVMEILQIQWDLPFYLPGTGSTLVLLGMLTTKDPNFSTAAIPNTAFNKTRAEGWCVDYLARGIATGNTTVSNAQFDEPVMHDLTDGAGHGILVATDALFLTVSSEIGASGATGAQSNILCKLLYRWKEVALEEYIGIVQSQQ